MEVAESSSTLEDSLERKQPEDIYGLLRPSYAKNADDEGSKSGQQIVWGKMGNPLDRYKNRTILGGWEYREKHPAFIPVSVEKDLKSDIPGIDMKKYRVHAEMPLGEFILPVRMMNDQVYEKPWFAFFSSPPTGALIGQIDEEFKDDDGFLRMTFSGEESFDGSNVSVDNDGVRGEQQDQERIDH